MKSRDFYIGSIVCEKENGPVEFVFGIENLGSRKAIPPSLAVTIDHTLTIDLDVPEYND